MSDLYNKTFIGLLKPFLMHILAQDLSYKQQVLLRNVHKFSPEKKSDYSDKIRKEINAKEKANKRKK